MVEAAANGRLRVELGNGHRLEIDPPPKTGATLLHHGARGRAELPPHPTAGWLFTPAP